MRWLLGSHIYMMMALILRNILWEILLLPFHSIAQHPLRQDSAGGDIHVSIAASLQLANLAAFIAGQVVMAKWHGDLLFAPGLLPFGSSQHLVPASPNPLPMLPDHRLNPAAAGVALWVGTAENIRNISMNRVANCG